MFRVYKYTYVNIKVGVAARKILNAQQMNEGSNLFPSPNENWIWYPEWTLFLQLTKHNIWYQWLSVKVFSLTKWVKIYCCLKCIRLVPCGITFLSSIRLAVFLLIAKHTFYINDDYKKQSKRNVFSIYLVSLCIAPTINKHLDVSNKTMSTLYIFTLYIHTHTHTYT